MSLEKLKREQIAGLIGVLGVNPIDNKIKIVYINDKTEYACYYKGKFMEVM